MFACLDFGPAHLGPAMQQAILCLFVICVAQHDQASLKVWVIGVKLTTDAFLHPVKLYSFAD